MSRPASKAAPKSQRARNHLFSQVLIEPNMVRIWVFPNKCLHDSKILNRDPIIMDLTFNSLDEAIDFAHTETCTFAPYWLDSTVVVKTWHTYQDGNKPKEYIAEIYQTYSSRSALSVDLPTSSKSGDFAREAVPTTAWNSKWHDPKRMILRESHSSRDQRDAAIESWKQTYTIAQLNEIGATNYKPWEQLIVYVGPYAVALAIGILLAS